MTASEKNNLAKLAAEYAAAPTPAARTAWELAGGFIARVPMRHEKNGRWIDTELFRHAGGRAVKSFAAAIQSWVTA